MPQMKPRQGSKKTISACQTLKKGKKKKKKGPKEKLEEKGKRKERKGREEDKRKESAPAPQGETKRAEQMSQELF